MIPRTTRIAESALIVIGIVSLWPWILGHRSGWYTAACLAVLALLAGLAVWRFLRVKRAFEKLQSTQGSPRDPGIPPDAPGPDMRD
ncbi:MAG: hypothetical protein GY851_27085 [bacterium]|nr:hypothetical protein [bacterium]